MAGEGAPGIWRGALDGGEKRRIGHNDVGLRKSRRKCVYVTFHYSDTVGPRRCGDIGTTFGGGFGVYLDSGDMGERGALGEHEGYQAGTGTRIPYLSI